MSSKVVVSVGVGFFSPWVIYEAVCLITPLSRRPSVAPSLCSMDAEMRRGVAWPGDAWLLTPRSTGQRRSYPVVTPTRQLTKSQDRHRSTTDHIIIVIIDIFKVAETVKAIARTTILEGR